MFASQKDKTNHMSKINLKRIVETAGLRPTDLGRQLFPGKKHPYKSITRVINGLSNLDADQVLKLSQILNVPVDFLYEDARWGSTIPANSRTVRFRTSDYFAELDLETMTTTVSKNGTLYFEKLTHTKDTKISEYLQSLKDLIIKNS